MQSQNSSKRPPSHPPVYVQKLQSELKAWLTGADPWVSRLGWRVGFWEAYASPLLQWGLRLLREVALLSSVWPRMRRHGAHWSLVSVSSKSGFTATTHRWAGYESVRKSLIIDSKCHCFAYSFTVWKLIFPTALWEHKTPKRKSFPSISLLEISCHNKLLN